MASALVGEPGLVASLLIDHGVELGPERLVAGGSGVGGGIDVLADVHGFEPARGVHREEATTQEAEHTEEAADRPHGRLTPPDRAGPERAQQVRHLGAVVPLGGLDPLDLVALAATAGTDAGAPVPLVGVRGGELARVRGLQDPDQRLLVVDGGSARSVDRPSLPRIA